MCLLVVAWRKHPCIPLLAAGNRDEFHSRPTRPAAFWPDCPDILAGRDEQAGGTWMGVTRTGRFAAITNVRERGAPAGTRSRGELPARFLGSDVSAAAFLRGLAREQSDYAGFNLLVCDGRELHYLSNRDPRGPRRLGPGLHALSNHLLETPWPKLLRLRERFAERLEADQCDARSLLPLLDDRRPARPDELPDTGLDPALEKRLSAPFVVGEEYGTRSATLAWLWDDGVARYHERRFDPAGEVTGDSRFRFTLESGPGAGRIQ